MDADRSPCVLIAMLISFSLVRCTNSLKQQNKLCDRGFRTWLRLLEMLNLQQRNVRNLLIDGELNSKNEDEVWVYKFNIYVLYNLRILKILRLLVIIVRLFCVIFEFEQSSIPFFII